MTQTLNSTILSRLRAVRLLMLALLALLVGACANLSGEPNIVATIPAPTAAPTSEAIESDGGTTTAISLPEAAPNIQRGAEIYAQNCTQCHGIGGAGDGELVQSGQVMNPGNFVDPEYMADRDPQAYFNIITQGNLANLMPPWEQALTPQERWDVTMYVYTLHYDSAQVELGATLYADDCADCHGEMGAGGEVASPDLTDPATMVTFNDEALRVSLSDGADVEGHDLTLSADEIQAVTAYTRTLSLNTEGAAAIDVTVAEVGRSPIQAEPGQGATISGLITNGTTGGTMPDELTVTLHVIDPQINELTLDGQMQPNGTYQFEDIVIAPNNRYFVSAEYKAGNFATSLFELDAAQPVADVPLIIYEPTNDSSVIEIQQSVTQITPRGTLLEVTYEVDYINNSDRLYVSGEEIEEGVNKSVEFALPVGAVVSQVVDQSRYVIDDEEAFTVTDTRSIVPGITNRLQMIYLLPYERGAVVEFPTNYDYNGTFLLLIDSDDLNVEAGFLNPIPPETFPDLDMNAFGGNLTLAAGETIRYDLSGAIPGVGSSTDSEVITSERLLPLLLIVAVLSIGIIGLLVYLSNRAMNRTDARINALTQQLGQLERQHEAGEINHDLYHERRKQIVAEINTLTGKDDVQRPPTPATN